MAEPNTETLSPIASVPTARSFVRDGEPPRALVRRAKRGDPEATEDVVRLCWSKCHGIALGILGDPHLAQDVAQESMLAAIRGLPDFKINRPFTPWLQRIVVNRSLDQARKVGRRAETELEDFDEPIAPEDPHAPHTRLLVALGTLSPADRAMIGLRYIAELNSTEIGEILELKPATVRSTLSRSVARLREELEPTETEEESS